MPANHAGQLAHAERSTGFLGKELAVISHAPLDPLRWSEDASQLFRWETLRERGAFTIPYVQPVHGRILEVELISGARITVFRGEDTDFYFCHGLTFGGIFAPGGAISPFSGKDVLTILAKHYQEITPESAATAGDILVWRGLGEDTPHSAILVEPLLQEGAEQLAYSARVLTKNGRLPLMEMTLGRLTGDEFCYGDSFKIFRRIRDRSNT